MIRPTPTGVELDVRVIPRARQTGIAGTRDNALLVRVAAPPVDGAANQELVELLARLCHVPRAAIRLVGGESNRRKRVAVDGVTAEQIRAAIVK